MAGTVKTNEVKLVSPNGLVEKTLTLGDDGIVKIDGIANVGLPSVNFMVSGCTSTGYLDTGIVKIPYGYSIIRNVGNGFSSGRFTAPISGVYLINAIARAVSGTAENKMGLYKNGVAVLYSSNMRAPDGNDINISSLIYLAQGDYIEIMRVNGIFYASNELDSYFSGSYICQ